MEKAGCAGLVLASIAVVGSGAAALFYSLGGDDGDDKGDDLNVLNEETFMMWASEDYQSGAPPTPRFNIYDNEDCRE